MLGWTLEETEEIALEILRDHAAGEGTHTEREKKLAYGFMLMSKKYLGVSHELAWYENWPTH